MKSLSDILLETSWIPAWHETGACMDRRHILWLRKVLEETAVRRTLEIGVHSGASSSAFVAAKTPDAHFCDISPRPESFKILEGVGLFHRAKGCEVIRDHKPFQLIFVDGNHSLDAVQEEVLEILKEPPEIVVAHDVNSTVAGFGACEGAHFLWKSLQKDGWCCFVDAEDRPGEMTKRGMLVASKNPQHLLAINRAWDQIL